MNLELTIKNLNKNGMSAYCVKTKEEVLGLLKELTKEGDTVAFGGSVTNVECGVSNFLKQNNYNLVDRSDYEKAYSADVYICSSNAITETGTLYNVDGRSNRVSAIAHGPKSVIIIAGTNKIVENLEAAINRVKTIAAPKNCQRLGFNTYCTQNGKCVSLNLENPEMTDGCQSNERICCNYLISAKQRQTGRIKVILVEQNLGM